MTIKTSASTETATTAYMRYLGATHYNMFLRKATAEAINPETLPPAEGAAAQHSFHVYLQTRNWMLLQSMSSDPSNYGLTVGAHGYEPVLTLDPMAPEELLWFTTCSCNGGCSNQRCCCKKNDVMCISACRNCKGIISNNCANGDVESGEDSDLDY